jgi:hypothetical protein
MQTLDVSTFSVTPIAEKILNSRQITRADQQLLLIPHPLSLQEQQLIDRVFDRLRQGFLRVVD